MATLAVFALGAVSVSALSVPGTSVTVPNTTVTVQTPTVRVPTTAPTPPPAPKVTPPKVTPPKQPAAPSPVQQVTKPVTNVVKKAVPQATNPVKQAVPQTTNTVKKAVPQATNPVTNGGGSSGGRSSGTPPGPAGPVDRILGSVTGGLGATTGTARNTAGALGSSTGTAGSTAGSTAAGGPTYFGGPGGGAGGPGGGMFGGGSSAGGFDGFGGGSAAGGGSSLAMMLAGASPKQLRSVLDHLEGCLPALPAIDRRVISMRAGMNGAPLTRPQVGARLGLSRQTVRNTERRALNRLQFAAANTGCAATVVGPFDAAGIGNLTPQLIFAGAVPVNGSSASPAGDSGQTRGVVAGVASPLFSLDGGGQSGPAWAIILFTVLFSVAIAALTRELRSSF